jgi:copper chaperone CopZ
MELRARKELFFNLLNSNKMKKTYDLEGMTCKDCAINITGVLLNINEVQEANVQLNPQQVTITMSKHFGIDELQNQITKSGQYTIRETHPV